MYTIMLPEINWLKNLELSEDFYQLKEHLPMENTCKMLIFECTKCGRKIKADYEICCTHSSICKGEKPPECCSQPMI
jgi:hypothetical protein